MRLTARTFSAFAFLAIVIPFILAHEAGAQTSHSNKGSLPKTLPPKKVTTKSRATVTRPVVTTDDQDTDNEVGNASEQPGKKTQRVPLNSNNMIRLNYGYPEWNKNPAKIDSASLMMREGSSGRTVQIYLEETAPNSSVFSGIYSINWQNIERLQVEFYVPPQSALASIEGMKKIMAMINSKELKRKPFILRRAANGLQSVEIFDTKDQARMAMKAYYAEQQIQALRNRKLPSDQEVDTAKLAEELKQREAAARSLADRIRLGQVEARRIQDLLSKFWALSAAERTARKLAAQKLAAEGIGFYRDGKLKEAQEKFENAVELDPETRSYYFQFGVTLHRNGFFNRSIVYLDLAEGPEVNEIEKQYYIGLNYYALKEFENALAGFGKVIASGHSEMAPVARFYVGLVKFEQKKWDESQAAFQEVLDTSKDPQLDKQAEMYIEQILRVRQFEEERSKKWAISATIGELYDSNVLLSSDSALDTGTASNSSGYRTLISGSVKYRPIYEATKEFAIQLDLLTMYTLDQSFQSLQSLRNTDPTIASLTLPWTHKGLLFGKGHKLDVSPGYETIYMSVENNENKEILNTYILNVSNLLVMNDTWFSTYILDIRKDNSKLTSSTGDDDSSALKVKLANSNILMISDDKTKIATGDFAYTLNQAQGKNSAYNRLDLSVGYLQPTFWETNTNVKLSYFKLNYPQKSDNRTDDSYSLSVGLSKKLDETWNLGSLASYNINNSNVDANQYKKWSAMLTLSGNWGF